MVQNPSHPHRRLPRPDDRPILRGVEVLQSALALAHLYMEYLILTGSLSPLDESGWLADALVLPTSVPACTHGARRGSRRLLRGSRHTLCRACGEGLFRFALSQRHPKTDQTAQIPVATVRTLW